MYIYIYTYMYEYIYIHYIYYIYIYIYIYNMCIEISFSRALFLSLRFGVDLLAQRVAETVCQPAHLLQRSGFGV